MPESSSDCRFFSLGYEFVLSGFEDCFGLMYWDLSWVVALGSFFFFFFSGKRQFLFFTGEFGFRDNLESFCSSLWIIKLKLPNNG